MRKTVFFGAALALAMTGGALAQTTTPSPGGEIPPPPVEMAPGVPAPDAPGAATPDANASPSVPSEGAAEPGAADAMQDIDRMRQRSERRQRRQAMRESRGDKDAGWRRHSGEDMDGERRHERFDWRDHHRGGSPMGDMGMRGRGGPQGAVFRFSGGEDGPSITIRCANRDTTQECVDAVGPMLQMMLPNAQ